MAKPKDYAYNLYEGHGSGKRIGEGWILGVRSMEELRRRANAKMSKTKLQTMEVSTAKHPHYSETSIEIYNHYFGKVNYPMGEWWDKNGMHAYDKATGKALGKTGR